jgi:choline monooxygenase
VTSSAPPTCFIIVNMPLFEIDPDIRKAETLSSRFYTDPDHFELSKDKIFSRTWQLAGNAGELPGLMPVNLLPGFLDEPLLLSKKDGAVRCLSNVCTHRGKILVKEPCEANLIRCGYHGRRFALDGKFLSMPEFEGVENFPGEKDNLTEVPSEAWNGFVFASIAPAAPFDAFAGEMKGRIDEKKLEFAGRKEYETDAHWALYCENYLEGFHIPFVHHSLNEVVDYGTYSTETFRYSSLQTGHDKQGDPAAHYFFIFPNLMFNFYPWGLSINIVRPVSPGKSIVEFQTYVSDESKIEQGAGADLHRVEMEDEAVVESVQRGIRSRFYDRGRYSPTREQGTHHFHRLIAEFMG